MASNEEKAHRRARKKYSCEPCRRSKLRCDRQDPCSSCKNRACEDDCAYNIGKTAHVVASRSSPRPAEITPHSSDMVAAAAPITTAPACHDFSNARWDAVFERPIQNMDHAQLEQTDLAPQGNIHLFFPFYIGPRLARNDLLSKLPPWDCCEYLITQYFTLLSPLFHVLHGPTFEHQYCTFRNNPSNVDLSWLAVFFFLLSMAVRSIEGDDVLLAKLWPEPHAQDATVLSYQLRTAGMICLAQDNFLNNHSISTLEALLILIFTISHDEGVDKGWVLLGMALNIGIALQCNVDYKPPDVTCIEVERRRRCWAGILLLHTYQAIMFRDVDIAWLTKLPAVMPANVNDKDVQEHVVGRPSSQPTQMSVMIFKLRLFQLSNRICSRISNPTQLDETTLVLLDAEIAAEQEKWDTTFLSQGRPSLLDASSNAYWSILQLYAHHLYLLIHRPFCRSNSNSSPSKYRPESKTRCIRSGAALLDFHRQLCEDQRLRHYRWLVYGMTSSYALHGAVALASCLLDRTGENFDCSPYRAAFDAAILRVEKLQDRSPICKKAYPILRHFQTMLSPDIFLWSDPAGYEFGNTMDDWIDSVKWLNPGSDVWNYWDDILNVDGALNPP
ncbi:uncharacterized protein TRUGW13939_10225 [Talaromyces rugulosus]|uniref:Zn(2)-C6 fungal-type domain-containing protein n=1 Tax=Talaromyces rugulosus TaxID=121627 RepID=A0A7H8RAA1_TALRU|nr:uncharacterized protein TRUGW13939_10225 [Talaromyces rugulosus]QKX63057.1 hypothetical protein TRUGW13939_10225 [Talaromyces rugulosus]